MYTDSRVRSLKFAAALITIVAACSVFAASASATNVNLRVEGTAGTFFSGPVSTNGGSVPGDPANGAYCHSNTTPNVYGAANGLTAVVAALGAANVTTSGTNYSWGVQLCSINGEGTPASGGWLTKINNKSASLPAGFASATDPLSEGDTILFYRITSYVGTDASLDLKLPANVPPGQSIATQVNEWADSNDAKSAPSGVTVSGGGATATTDSNGQANLVFPASGKFLVTAEKSGKIRGSAYVTVDPAAPAPIVHINRFVKCNKTYKKSSRMHRRCVRIVRAKQAAAAGK
ncbi:MAG: hypothetical protein ACRDKI_07025 [Solirubrobacterales bacterium]